MPLVLATTLFGANRLVAKETLIPRRAAYAVVIDQGRLLLVSTRSTGKWFFPGGQCEPAETDLAAVIREVYEETGIKVSVAQLLLEVEHYWYDDTTGAAYQQLGRFFRCHAQTFLPTRAANPEPDDQAEQPTWVPLTALQPADFQGFAGEVFRLLVADS